MSTSPFPHSLAVPGVDPKLVRAKRGPITAGGGGRSSVHAPGGASMVLPTLIADAGVEAARITLEFFAARVPNAHTRKAYGRAVWRFCAWCAMQGVALHELVPTAIAAYYELLRGEVSLPTLKLQSSAIRHWLDYLTERGVLPHNPARSVRTARLSVSEGKTPVLEREQARRLFAALDADDSILGLRDRAMCAVMLFGFVRVGALVAMNVRDFEDQGEAAWLVLHEKGGKERRIPCHHQARIYVQQYITRAGLDPKSRCPLFQSAPRRSAALSGKRLSTNSALEVVKRRCAKGGLPSSICCHSFRATGITLHQEAGGRLEDAQQLAGHADARTTRLYVRTQSRMQQREVERVQL